MDWLILKEVLITVCNIMSAAYKGLGGWVNDAVDTANQVVCTVGQIDGHSSPDHTKRRTDVELNSLEPQATQLMHPSVPTGSVLVMRGLIGLAKSRL